FRNGGATSTSTRPSIAADAAPRPLTHTSHAAYLRGPRQKHDLRLFRCFESSFDSDPPRQSAICAHRLGTSFPASAAGPNHAEQCMTLWRSVGPRFRLINHSRWQLI